MLGRVLSLKECLQLLQAEVAQLTVIKAAVLSLSLVRTRVVDSYKALLALKTDVFRSSYIS